jgi:hypothetical protein
VVVSRSATIQVLPKRWGNFLLVPGLDMDKVKSTMKRLLTLIALLGLAVGVFSGCEQSSTDNKAATDTNAPAAPATTNK